MNATATVIAPPERPRVPLYLDTVACALCGDDGHEVEECPLLVAREAPAKRDLDTQSLAA